MGYESTGLRFGTFLFEYLQNTIPETTGQARRDAPSKTARQRQHGAVKSGKRYPSDNVPAETETGRFTPRGRKRKYC